MNYEYSMSYNGKLIGFWRLVHLVLDKKKDSAGTDKKVLAQKNYVPDKVEAEKEFLMPKTLPGKKKKL